jgi:hypothetical protein
MKKRLNLVLTNGLLIVNAKIREGSPVITLFVTDYSESTRILFDVEQKRILANRDGIEFSAKDVESLLVALGVKEVKAI